MESKSYKHDNEGAWRVLVFEKMEPQQKLLNNDERFMQFYKIVDKWISKGEKYKMVKVNDILFFERINQVQDINAYICTVSLKIQNGDENNENEDEDTNIITEDFLIEEEISSGTMSLRYVIYRNPNL